MAVETDHNKNVTLYSFRRKCPDEVFSCREDESVFSSIGSKSLNHRTVPSSAAVQAVTARNVYFSYRKLNHILRGINLNVPVGCIYSLLGPSGCGKTTLLRCIIGCSTPHSGDIRVFGTKPGTPSCVTPGSGVGYMPQELSLYEDLTINEHLSYFGFLYDLEPTLIYVRINHLIKLLDLPEKDRLVSQLSCGQKRRVSLAAAVIHNPPLVILDEPTVGVDPILRENIWYHLQSLSLENKISIVITTHYIEEARRAHLVGFMRKGRLLEEDTPDSLLERFNLTTLEDVFLNLCTKREPESPEINCSTIEALGPDTSTKFVPLNPEHYKKDEIVPHHLQVITSNGSTKKAKQGSSARIWFHVLTTLIWKSFIRSFRHPSLIVFQYLLPLTQIILFCVCIGGEPFDILIGILNEEQPTYLSELFIKNLDLHHMKLKNYTDFETARRDVKVNAIWGFLHIQANFSDCLIERFNPHNYNITNATLEQSKIRLYADLTNKFIHIHVERSLDETFQLFLREALIEYEIDPGIGRLPISLAEPIYGVYKHPTRSGYREYMAPGMILMSCFGLAYALTSLLLILERNDKMFERHFVAGVTTNQILLAHAVNRTILMIVQVIIVFFVTIYVFSIQLKGSFLTALSLLFVQNISGMALGMVLSSMCRQVNTASILGVGLMFFILFMSGIVWPVEAIPTYLRWFSTIQPNTIPIQSLRNILAKGWSFTDPGVYSGFLVSLFWSVVFFFIGMKTFKYH